MFGKFFASTWTGSMCGAGAHVFSVWAYALSTSDADGCVELNPAFMAPIIGMSRDDVQRALDYLLSPDPMSRSQEEGGRRLMPDGAFQYKIVTYPKYRAIRNEEARKDSNRRASKKYRASVRKNLTRADESAPSAHAEEEADAEEDLKKRNSTVELAGLTPSSRAPRSTASAEVVRVHETWQRACGHPRSPLTPRRVRMLSDRLREGYTVDDLCRAAQAVGADAWHRGENDRHRRFDSLEVIFRDAGQLDKALALTGPKAASKADEVSARFAAARRIGDEAEMARLLPEYNAVMAEHYGKQAS